jgi:hypothetical protein
MSVKQPYRLHGPKMQAPAWLPANAQGIDLAARLHSNGRCRSHRIRGMAARRIRQRCSRDNRRGAPDGTVTTLRPPLRDAITNAAANVCFCGKADMMCFDIRFAE